MNKEQLAKDCIRLVGGKRNIKNCGHCSTRLRLTLKNLGGRFAPQGTVDQLYKAFGLDARSVADSVEEMLHEQ